MQGRESHILANDANVQPNIFKLFKLDPVSVFAMVSNNLSYPITNILGIYGQRYLKTLMDG